MLPIDDNNYLNWPKDHFSGPQYSVRPYASRLTDLDVDFKSASQAELVTRVVANCLLCDEKPLPEAEVWLWSLQKRLQALLSITLSSREPTLTLQTHCGNKQCAEVIELPLELGRFLQSIESDEFSFAIDDKTLTTRLPNGLDQQKLMQYRNLSATDMARNLVLRIDDELPEENWYFPEAWLGEIAQALENHDELMTLQLDTSCPACNQPLDIAVDLEAQLLASLSLVQQKLLREIHYLALAYHWREADIFALTVDRRQFYLAQVRGTSAGATLQ